MPHANHALPVGSRILVTGANGYISTQVIEQLLLLGYIVRGTVRAPKPWLDAYFHQKYGVDAFEPVIVKSFTNRDEIESVLDGVDGIVHAATDVSLNSNPDQVIPWVVQSTLDVLDLAAQRPAIKRVVLVSSSTAVYGIHQGIEHDSVDENTWNDRAIRTAWDPEFSGSNKETEVYSASKTEAERQSYKWVKEHKPNFVLNSVLPCFTLGKILSPEMFGSSMGYARQALKGDYGVMSVLPQHWFVDVEDIARLCVIGLLDPSVQSERLFGFAENKNGQDLLTIMQKLRPNNPHLKKPAENVTRDQTEVLPRKRAEDLLRKFYGQPGWTSIEDSLAKGIEGWE